MRFALITFGLLLVASLLFLGEVAWLLCLCFWVGRVWFSVSPRALRVAAMGAGVAVIGAHFAGFKIYGSPIVRDNRPVLDSPHEFAALASPNIVLATDGSRFELRGVTFTPELLALPADDLRRLLNRHPEPLFIQADAASPSGVVLQRRCEYWCGNTFFPTFLPRRLPAYAKTDAGNYLTVRGVAKPLAE